MLEIIQPEALQENVFSMIGKQWLLIGAEKNGKVNAMTASWGGMGVLWNKNVVTIYIRPQRFTKEFVDASDTFSIMVFSKEKHSLLNYMGTISGRDENKMEHCDFHIDYIDETPYVKEAMLIITCRKLYAQTLTSKGFLDSTLDEKNYPTKDYHTMYVGEIINIYENRC